MHVETALDLIEHSIRFPRDLVVTASDYRHRQEDAVRICVTVPNAPRTERAFAPDYPEDVPDPGAQAWFVLPVAAIATVEDLALSLLDIIAEVRSHEDREQLRVGPTWWAPAHPHRSDGIARWAAHKGTDPARDYYYGTA